MTFGLGQYEKPYSRALYKDQACFVGRPPSVMRYYGKGRETASCLSPPDYILRGRDRTLDSSKAVIEMTLCPHCYALDRPEVKVRGSRLTFDEDFVQPTEASCDERTTRPDLLPGGGSLEGNEDLEPKHHRRTDSVDCVDALELVMRSGRLKSRSAPDLVQLSRCDEMQPTVKVLSRQTYDSHRNHLLH